MTQPESPEPVEHRCTCGREPGDPACALTPRPGTYYRLDGSRVEGVSPTLAAGYARADRMRM